MPVGVLALQGDSEAHVRALSRAGLAAFEVRTAEGARAAEALVLPGGESTAMWKLMEGTGIEPALQESIAAGRPVFATCAGAILLSRRVTNPEQKGLGVLDATAERNAYGRQLDSAVVRLTDLDRETLGTEPLEAVFIRAPKLSELGSGVAVLARRDGDPVLVRQANLLVATFHPELSEDLRVPAIFARMVAAARNSPAR